MQKVTLGGERLGSGKKMQVELKGYERSTHDLGYIFRTTQAPGTLVPFIVEVALPGDTFDIDLDEEVMTHPTIGPLLGSMKSQKDIFITPIRLYNSKLHNNALNIGRDMSKIKLPQIRLTSTAVDIDHADIDNSQINPSCILKYLGISGIGISAAPLERDFNATALIALWDIYKNYYANKQEEIGAVIHTPAVALIDTIDTVTASGDALVAAPATTGILMTSGDTIILNRTSGDAAAILNQIMILVDGLGLMSLDQLGIAGTYLETLTTQTITYNATLWGNRTFRNWRYRDLSDVNNGKPAVVTFPLENIDTMRELILAFNTDNTPFVIDDTTLAPYGWLAEQPNGIPNILSSQEGLPLKTYQSDLFNNWLNEEWIDGTNGIAEVTAIDTSGGSFTIDEFQLKNKIYNMLNRIAVSDGTYHAWVTTVWDHQRHWIPESPVYMGGLIKEIIFQTVISNSQSETDDGEQPLGTLAGRGTLAKKHKGGHVTIKVDEPCYIIGITSITPRIDYSQGNKWDVNLKSLDDLHKPELDQIGFQDLIIEQMAWWSTVEIDNVWTPKSAGKQPAWINYMTNVNKTFGNFAVQTNEMFMTLNRRYEPEDNGGGDLTIKDLTTYIDPSKYNFIFAQTSLDAMNFWVQIAVNMTVRRKMSAKIMPNL